MFNIHRKNALARNLQKMDSRFPGIYDFYPKTWILPLQRIQLGQYLMSNPGKFCIAKPSASCQGKGIFIFNKETDLPKSGELVVQEYINK